MIININIVFNNQLYIILNNFSRLLICSTRRSKLSGNHVYYDYDRYEYIKPGIIIKLT
jgi:hypothetical protein